MKTKWVIHNTIYTPNMFTTAVMTDDKMLIDHNRKLDTFISNFLLTALNW